MEEIPYLWSHQESNDELKLKIHYTALELEAVKAKANEQMNKNTESVKQLLHLLKLVCHERDEAKDQIQKLLNKITHPMNKSTIQDHRYPFIKPRRIAESRSLPQTDRATLVMESMIKGKALPQKGSLLKAVIEAGPLLQTLLATNPLPSWKKMPPQNHSTMMANESQQLSKMCYGGFAQSINGGSIWRFNAMSSSNFEGRFYGPSCPTASNFGLVEKRQRIR